MISFTAAIHLCFQEYVLKIETYQNVSSCHQLGLDRPVSAFSISPFKGHPSRRRPFSLQLNIIFVILLLFILVTCRRQFNPLNPELNPICYLLALLGAHHFLHVSRIRVKLLTFRRLMSSIYMEHPFLMFLDHTQRRSTVGRTPLDE